MSRTYVSIDLETTGLDPHHNEIIEVGAVKFQDGRTLAEFQSLVKPRQAMPAAITELTGITDEDLADAPNFAVIAGDLLLFLHDCVIVGQNVSFDLQFLAEQGLELPNPVFDTLELAKILEPYLLQRNLTALTDHFGVQYDTKHRAVADAIATMEVYQALMERALQLDLRVLNHLASLGSRTSWGLTGFFQEVLDEKLISSVQVATEVPVPPRRMTATRPEPAAQRVEAGEAHQPRQQVQLDLLSDLIGSGGLFSAHFPGFEHRPEQAAMLHAAARALNEHQHLLVEAGTGTGKSVAYLLPALFYALLNRTNIVVSTNTIALQEQIVQKDLPNLLWILQSGREAYPEIPDCSDARFAQLKGRGNYLCPRRWQTAAGGGLTNFNPSLLARITVWLDSTETGDRAELNLNATEQAAWSRISAVAENCPAFQCMMAKEQGCFLQKARKRAAEADVLVVNHALLVSDLQSGNNVLPDYDYLVIDEAHHLEEVATDQMGFRMGLRECLDFLERLYYESGDRPHGLVPGLEATLMGSGPLFNLQQGLAQELASIRSEVAPTRARVDALFETLAGFLREQGGGSGDYGHRARLTGGARSQPLWSKVEQGWEDVRVLLHDTQLRLERIHGQLEALPSDQIAGYDDFLAEVAALHFSAEQLVDHGNAVIARADPAWVTWLAGSGQGEGASLYAAPIEVGSVLQRDLFSKKSGVVLTSATLRTGTDFSYIKSRLGLEQPVELAVDSSFPYEKAALLLIPQDAPQPNAPGSNRVIEQAIADLCSASGGRSLVLFTSYAALQSAQRALNQTLAPQGISVLAQGSSGNIQRMLERLRNEPRTVILGTSSFWEGVDVVGAALSLLILTRLPFTVPTEPVFAARSELFDDPFREYAVPQAVLRFRQGFGRLIRSKTDRGVAVVLDPRVAGRNYGSAFLDPLPPVTIQRCMLREAPSLIERWLSQPGK